jgi:hypothetical protein
MSTTTTQSAFQRARAKLPPKPSEVIALPPSVFAETWDDRPTEPVRVGLRIPSDYEVSCARAEAAKTAVELHPKDGDDEVRSHAMTDAFMRETCAVVMCDPNDVRSRYWPRAEDDVKTKLTSAGAQFIFDAFERHRIAQSPVHREASDDEVLELVDLLSEPAVLSELDAARAKRARRFIAFIVDELRGDDG